MRGAGEVGFVYDEDKLTGVFMTPSFCAEQESGIRTICNYFGIPIDYIETEEEGLDRYKITKVPAEYAAWEQDVDGETVFTIWFSDYGKPNVELREAIFRPDKNSIGAWSGRDFAIQSRGDDIPVLKKIDEAIKNLDAIIMTSGSDNPFSKPGLAIGIASAMPESIDAKMRAEHQATKKLYSDWEDMLPEGLRESLAENNCRWISLPLRYSRAFWGRKGNEWGGMVRRFHDENGEPCIKAWLNPSDQYRNNFGWYTVEELILWTENRGPIPKLFVAVNPERLEEFELMNKISDPVKPYQRNEIRKKEFGYYPGYYEDHPTGSYTKHFDEHFQKEIAHYAEDGLTKFLEVVDWDLFKKTFPNCFGTFGRRIL